MAQEASSTNEIPKTMRAVVCTAIGDPSKVLELVEDRKVPEPKEDKDVQAVVKVLYCALNSIDYKMITGNMGIFSKKADNVPGTRAHISTYGHKR